VIATDIPTVDPRGELAWIMLTSNQGVLDVCRIGDQCCPLVPNRVDWFGLRLAGWTGLFAAPDGSICFEVLDLATRLGVCLV